MKSFSTTPMLPSSTPSEPVSQLQADFVLRDGDSGPTAELSCLASSGSPPITYRLVGNDGRVLAQQRPLHGKPANFSLPLSETSSGFQCVAENSISVDSSALILLPPGEQVLLGLEQGATPMFRKVVWAGERLNLATVQGRAGQAQGLLHDSLAPFIAEARSELVTTLTGELPLAPTCILAGSLISIVVITSGMLNLTR